MAPTNCTSSAFRLGYGVLRFGEMGAWGMQERYPVSRWCLLLADNVLLFLVISPFVGAMIGGCSGALVGLIVGGLTFLAVAVFNGIVAPVFFVMILVGLYAG